MFLGVNLPFKVFIYSYREIAVFLVFMASKSYTVPSELSNLTSFDKNNSAGTYASYGQLRWPLTEQHDFLQIDVVEFQKTGDLQFEVTQSNTTDGQVTQTDGESAIQFDSVTTISDGTFLSNTQSKTKANVKERVLLPIPANVNYQDNPKYN